MGEVADRDPRRRDPHVVLAHVANSCVNEAKHSVSLYGRADQFISVFVSFGVEHLGGRRVHADHEVLFQGKAMYTLPQGAHTDTRFDRWLTAEERKVEATAVRTSGDIEGRRGQYPRCFET